MNLTYQHTKLACYASYIGSAVVNNFAAIVFPVVLILGTLLLKIMKDGKEDA